MSAASPTQISNIGEVSAYLPALALGYVYTIEQSTVLLILGCVSLFAGVVQHGFSRSIAGPEPKTNYNYRKNPLQRKFAAVFNGHPDDYPSSVLDVLEEGLWPIELRRIPVFIITVSSSAIIYLTSGYSILLLLERINEIDFFGLFLLVAIPLPYLWMIFWRMYPSIHYRADIDDASEILQSHEAQEQLLRLIDSKDGLETKDPSYTVQMGGKLTLSVESEHKFEDKGIPILEILAFGYVAYLNHSKFPESEFEATVEAPDVTVTMSIEAVWARKFQNNDWAKERYIKRVFRTVDSKYQVRSND